MLIYNLLYDLEECFHLKSLHNTPVTPVILLYYIFVLRFNRISKHACFYIRETTYDKQHILSSKKSKKKKKKIKN